MKIFDLLFGRRPAQPQTQPAPAPLPREEVQPTLALSLPGDSSQERQIRAGVPPKIFERIFDIAKARNVAPEQVVYDLLTNVYGAEHQPGGSTSATFAISPEVRARLMKTAAACGFEAHTDFAKYLILRAYKDVTTGQKSFRLLSRAQMRAASHGLIIKSFKAEDVADISNLALAKHSSIRRVGSTLLQIGYDDFFKEHA